MNLIHSNKHCDVIAFNITREWSEREKKHLINTHYDPEKITWHPPHKDNQQLSIVVFSPDGRKLGELVYTTWAFAACSSASLSGISKGVYWLNLDAEQWKSLVADIIDCILACERWTGYPPHRFFCSIPSRGPSYERLWYWFNEFFPTAIKKAYGYENLAHCSTEQQLYDVNTNVLAQWAKDYHAKQSVAPVSNSGVVVGPAVVSQPVPAVAAPVGDWLAEFALAEAPGTIRAG